MALSTLSQIYVVSTFVGSGFMLISMLMGHMPRGHGAAHGHGGHLGGHGGHGGGHAGHGGPGRAAIGHSGAGHGGGQALAGHSAAGQPAAGQPVSGHGTVGHGGTGNAGVASQGAQSGQIVSHGAAAHSMVAPNSAVGNGVAGDVSLAATGAAQTGARPKTMRPSMQDHTGHMHIGLEEEGVVEFILGLLNPLSIATFCAFFGLTGMILSIAAGLPALASLPIATFAGWLAVQIVVRTIGWLFANMGASSEARVEDLIGQLGELIVPISNGRPGQVTYIIQSKRYTAPAKSLDPQLDIPKKAKVQICDIRDNIMYVEPWNDFFGGNEEMPS